MIRNILLPGLLSSCSMFCLFYLWHGIVLNDFLNLKLLLPFFLTLVAIIYFTSGIIVSGALRVLNFSIEKILLKGFALGGVYGFFLYSVAVLYGLSFSTSLKIEHITIDYLWQMFEQGVGGLISAFFYAVSVRRKKMQAGNF